MNIIFDLDGTLADCEHRRHLVTKDRKDPQWEEFFLRCKHDTVIQPVREVFWALDHWQDDGLKAHDIRIWSGRSELVRNETIGWILDWLTCETKRFQSNEYLRMRPLGNTEPDDVLKERWLLEHKRFGWTPDLVFDDRKKVVDMWRRYGIMCAQVAPGDF